MSDKVTSTSISGIDGPIYKISVPTSDAPAQNSPTHNHYHFWPHPDWGLLLFFMLVALLMADCGSGFAILAAIGERIQP